MAEKKILLVSIVGTKNFGNRLQQYALQRVIEDMGFRVDLLIKRPLRLMFSIRGTMKSWLRNPVRRASREKKDISTARRTNKFLKAKKLFYKNCVLVPEFFLQKKNWSAYEYAVVGSDQVWHGCSGLTYLAFMEPAKRISYAPSFGFDQFPEEEIEAHRRGLNGMRALSCREQSGCELIRELTGREAQRVLDPTLLLTAAQWEKIEKRPDFCVPNHYLLINMLGTVLPAYEAEIKRLVGERSLQIVEISNVEDPEHYAVSPDEFLWLVHHADTICTDSYHTAIFSILYEKNLRVFKRNQENFNTMFGRLHDLLEPLELSELVYGSGNGLSTVLSEQAKAKLAADREASLAYLRKSLPIE